MNCHPREQTLGLLFIFNHTVKFPLEDKRVCLQHKRVLCHPKTSRIHEARKILYQSQCCTDPGCPRRSAHSMHTGYTLPNSAYLWCLQSPGQFLRQKENLVWSLAKHKSDMEARVTESPRALLWKMTPVGAVASGLSSGEQPPSERLGCVSQESRCFLCRRLF